MNYQSMAANSEIVKQMYLEIHQSDNYCIALPNVHKWKGLARLIQSLQSSYWIPKYVKYYFVLFVGILIFFFGIPENLAMFVIKVDAFADLFSKSTAAAAAGVL